MIRAAALLLALAAPARADLVQFDAGLIPKDGVLFSDDGYHFAYFAAGGGKEYWLVDGRARVKLPEGSLPPGGALSADGSILLHLLAATDAQGNPAGVAAAVNGRKAGAVYAEIQELKLSPSGRNAAYAARTSEGWKVVSRQGVGPAFVETPYILGVSDAAVLYIAATGDAAFLYRNHKAVSRADYDSAAVSPDLRRVAGVLKAPGGSGVLVEIDGKRTGPWASASQPAVSPNGRHVAYLAEKLPSHGAGYDALIVDGHPAPMKPCAGCTVTVDDAGRVFEDKILVAVDPRGEMHQCFLDGKELGRPVRVGFAAGGVHYVYPELTGRGAGVGLDGKFTEDGAPLPILSAAIPIAFDGTDEYHYWTQSPDDHLRLVCGAVDGQGARTRCAQLGASLYTAVAP